MQQNAAVFSLPEVELEGKMVEKWVFEQSCRFGLHLLKTILAGLDEELCRNRPSGWRHKGYEERTVQTALGKLSFSRRIYVNQFSGERVAPLDEYLGWEKHARVSPEVKAMCVEMAPEMSFRAVSWAVNRLRGIEVSAEAAHQIVQDYGSVRGEQVDAEIREMYEDPKSATGTKECTLFFEIDSMYARQQGPGKRNIEIKLGVVHEGWVRERSTQERYRLKNKKVVVDSRDGGHLWDRLTAALSKEYDLSRCKIIINGDGAEWIQKGIDVLPECRVPARQVSLVEIPEESSC